MLSDQDLAAIEERCSKATPGPWIVARGPEWSAVKGAIGHELLKISGVNHGSGPNAAFIASSREDVPKLIEEVKRLRDTVNASRAKALEEAAEIAGQVAGLSTYDYQTARNIQEKCRARAKETPSNDS